MSKQRFNYDREYSYNDYREYGFHKKKDRFHIDTKRLKKLKIDDAFPKALFSAPRNTHYFIPKCKYESDYAVNILTTAIKKLKNDWEEEYVRVLKAIKTPEEVYDNVRTNELMMTSCADDIDEIEMDARIEQWRRRNKYIEILQSIHLSYIQRIVAEYFRVLFIALEGKGLEYKDDFSYGSLMKYAVKVTNTTHKTNPVYKLEHYKYFDVLNKINNFLKHNSLDAYNSLANNPEEKDEELKKFQASFVYTKEETSKEYKTGMYAGDWIKYDKNFIVNSLNSLLAFSRELCELLFKEDSEEASWNSDEALLRILRDDIIYVG